MSPREKPLLARTNELTAQNAQDGKGAAPPLIAGQSPLHEVLLTELGAALPAPLAGKVKTATTVGQVQDLLAAGALYEWVAADSYAAGQFLLALEKQPQEAGLALVKAVAAKHQPPERESLWHRLDRTGLTLQLALAAGILTARALLFLVLVSALDQAGVVDLPTLLRSAVVAGLVPAGRTAVLFAAVVFLVTDLWLTIEAAAAPRLLEFVRQLPARWRKLPPPLSWRADGFHVVWQLQAVLFLVAAKCSLVAWLGNRLWSGHADLATWLGTVASAVWVVFSTSAVWRFAPRSWKLGTQ